MESDAFELSGLHGETLQFLLDQGFPVCLLTALLPYLPGNLGTT